MCPVCGMMSSINQTMVYVCVMATALHESYICSQASSFLIICSIYCKQSGGREDHLFVQSFFVHTHNDFHFLLRGALCVQVVPCQTSMLGSWCRQRPQALALLWRGESAGLSLHWS